MKFGQAKRRLGKTVYYFNGQNELVAVLIEKVYENEDGVAVADVLVGGQVSMTIPVRRLVP